MSLFRGLTHLFQFDVIKTNTTTPVEGQHVPSNRFRWAEYTPPAPPEEEAVYGEYGHAAAIRALYQPTRRAARLK
jgi:hypothetical protein